MDSNEEIYLNPITDFGFKKIFGEPDVMQDLLNDLIHSRGIKSDIIEIEYLMQEDHGALKTERGVVYDLKCKTNAGEIFIIEMQNKEHYNFDKRIAFYLARAVASQGDKEEERERRKKAKENNEEYIPWQYDLHNVFGVFFMNFIDDNEPMPISHNACCNTATGKITNDLAQFWKIQLPHFRKMREEDCTNNLEYWAYIMANEGRMTKELPFKGIKTIFEKVEQLSKLVNLTREEREIYDHELDMIRVAQCAKTFDYNKGKEEGLAEGIAEGMAKGVKQNSLVIARSMKSDGLPIDTIMKYTNLSREEVEAL